jgi:hypothetical protein
MHLPTLTAVLLSSSEALLPPGLLLTLMRLELRFGRIMALMGRGTPFAGEPGGEVAMGAATAAPLCVRVCAPAVGDGVAGAFCVGMARQRRVWRAWSRRCSSA